MRAIRQVNCVRQAIHSLLYLQLNGELPKDNDDLRSGAFASVYGGHIKFPLGNNELREQYESIITLCFRSADFLAVILLAILNIVLILLPLVELFVGGGSWGWLHNASLFLTLIYALLVYATVKESIGRIEKSISSENKRGIYDGLKIVYIYHKSNK